MSKQTKYFVIIPSYHDPIFYDVVDLERESSQDIWKVIQCYHRNLTLDSALDKVSQFYDMNILINNTKSWGKDRNTISDTPNKENAIAQFSKLLEEAAETLSHLNVMDTESGRYSLIDDLGDLFVTLIMTAANAGIPLDTALHTAYQTIKNRKGKLVNGVFVKDNED